MTRRSVRTTLGRIAVGSALASITARVARRRVVDDNEQALFRTVNELPSALHPPVYVVMQAGSFASVFVTGGLLFLSGRRRLGITTAVTGTAVWGGAKVVKRWVGRGRPAAHLDRVNIRGTEERGLGFPSGHAAVVTTLVTLVGPELPRGAVPIALVLAGTVGTARIYVGAHLPLDVVGGAAIGLAMGSAARLVYEYVGIS